MALQLTPPISFTDIQTEFDVSGAGTSNSFKDYVRGGAFVPDGPAENAGISLTAAGLEMSQFYGALGFDLTLDNHSISRTTSGGPPPSAIVQYYLRTDGDIDAFPQAAPADNWGRPLITDIGDGFWVMADNFTGDTMSSGPTSGVYYPLTSDVFWSHTNLGGGPGSTVVENGTMDVHIAASDGGPDIVSATLTWYTSVENEL